MKSNNSYPKGLTFVTTVLIIPGMQKALQNFMNYKESITTHPDLNYTVRYVDASSNTKLHPYIQIAE